jgi:pyruvate ferredoxin oxidoreductase alpha subunit
MKSLAAMLEKAGRDELELVTFLDLDWKAVNKQIEREKAHRKTGPVAEALLRDAGIVGARNY